MEAVEADQKTNFHVCWYISMAVIENPEEQKMRLWQIVKTCKGCLKFLQADLYTQHVGTI
jgi:hypothetical protein